MTTQTPDAVREALRYEKMGSRGRCDFNQLREAVAEAVIGDRSAGAPFSPDFRYGHQTVPGINYNSLDRIVTAFVDAALDSRAGDAREGDRYTRGYAQGQADAAQLHQWMQDKAWQDTVLMLVHYQTLADRTWLVGHEEAAAKLAEWWRHARALSETKSVEDIAATPAPAVDAQELGRPCDTCQGNGEVVTDWDRYMHGKPGDTGDEATKDCPDCDGTGRVNDAPAVDAVPAGEVRLAVAKAIVEAFEASTPDLAHTLSLKPEAWMTEADAAIAAHLAALSHGEGRK